MGAVALGKLLGDKNFDLTIISHVEPMDPMIYADLNYYFNKMTAKLVRHHRRRTPRSIRKRARSISARRRCSLRRMR